MAILIDSAQDYIALQLGRGALREAALVAENEQLRAKLAEAESAGLPPEPPRDNHA